MQAISTSPSFQEAKTHRLKKFQRASSIIKIKKGGSFLAKAGMNAFAHHGSDAHHMSTREATKELVKTTKRSKWSLDWFPGSEYHFY